MRTRVKKAFTLVEILIVVVILGILAAIVVPQFTRATQEAQGGNILAQLDTLNNQLELYKARHSNMNPPALEAGGAGNVAWAELLLDDQNYSYLKAPPKNPACPSTGDQAAVAVSDVGVADTGWNFADFLPSGAPDGTPDTIQACYFDEAGNPPRVTAAP